MRSPIRNHWWWRKRRRSRLLAYLGDSADLATCKQGPRVERGEVMSEDGWHKLEGISAATEKFPARAKIAGEGVLIFRTRTGFRGAERACPHLKASLMDAALMANDTVLRCANHN